MGNNTLRHRLSEYFKSISQLLQVLNAKKMQELLQSMQFLSDIAQILDNFTQNPTRFMCLQAFLQTLLLCLSVL